jgi:hypothetical protein
METALLRAWAWLLGSAALIAMVVLAFGIMVRAVKPSAAMGHLGVIAGVVILFLMLPAIMIAQWNSMTVLQHIGLIALGLAIASLFGVRRHRAKRMRHR